MLLFLRGAGTLPAVLARPKPRWNERADPRRDAISSQWIRTRSAKRRPAMKKNSTVRQSPKRAAARQAGPITIGMDLGDKTSRYCVLAANGEVLSEGSVATTRKAMAQKPARTFRQR